MMAKVFFFWNEGRVGSPDPMNLGSRKATEVVELSVFSIETSPCLNVGALIYIYMYIYICICYIILWYIMYVCVLYFSSVGSCNCWASSRYICSWMSELAHTCTNLSERANSQSHSFGKFWSCLVWNQPGTIFFYSQTDIARGFLKWIAGGFPPAATNGQSPQGKQL
jgi:hypothetical protein